MKRNLLTSNTSAALLLAVLVGCGQDQRLSSVQEAPDAENRSELMGVQVQKLSDLAKSAEVSEMGWSGDYWATARGGIAYHWQNGGYSRSWRDYIYPVKTESELRSMSQGEFDRLSASEKFDLYLGDHNFALTREEFRRTQAAVDSSGQVPGWFGICHGWAPAALLEHDPGNVATVDGPYGKKINFYNGDLKAIVSRQYADARVDNYFLGGRCNDEHVERDSSGRVLRSECRDSNPGSLHLTLADYIGKQGKGFVADVELGAQVWNQPIVGYSASFSNERYLSQDRNYNYAAPGTAKLVDVRLSLKYLVESNPTKDRSAPNLDTMDLAYTLELDSAGYIIGGEWISDARTDFLWQLRRQPTEVGDSTINYRDVKSLLDLSHGH
jgi:hypothetical protein